MSSISNLLHNVSESEVRSKIIAAIRHLHKNDQYLLDHDLNERSIAFRLALYIQQEFAGWNVDYEYNRMSGDFIKKLEDIAGTFNNITGNVFPDIIIHIRGSDNNLLVIEVKKNPSTPTEDKYDTKKLNVFKKELGYQFIAFIKFYNDFNNTVNHMVFSKSHISESNNGLIV